MPELDELHDSDGPKGSDRGDYLPAGKSMSTPGDGERRAQRGFTWQYRVAAKLIFDALASGQLRWIGVADRQAAKFDDLVLGLTDRVVAYQFKSSRSPKSFNIHTLLLGSGSVWKLILDARSNLSAGIEGLPLETVFVTADHPSDVDRIGEAGASVSSAAFLRTHAAQRHDWNLENWQESPFAPLVNEVLSETPEGGFEDAWKSAQFWTSFRAPESYPDKRIQDIANLLPILVADPLDKDRWTTHELLNRLSWSDPFGLLHSHIFPVDHLYQSNEATEKQLKDCLLKIDRGYLSLVGPPGSGKSTLLAAGLLPTPRAAILRYLAFIPTEGQGLGRAEAKDFFEDLIKQFKHQQLGVELVPGTEVADLRWQFQELLVEASERFKDRGVRTIIIVDGLDHVPREERPDQSFLNVLPHPNSVPNGVVILLGTQKLDLDDLPPAVRDQASDVGRKITVSPLSKEAVAQLMSVTALPRDVSINDLYEKCAGHPLSTRYVIEALVNAHSADDRENILKAGPTYEGDIESFYNAAWHAIENDQQAQDVLAYVALADGPISPIGLDQIVGPTATDSAFRAGGHFLVRDTFNAWSIFHNSFRLFIRRRTGMRHGLVDETVTLRRYEKLAQMTTSVPKSDPQRWLTLRYFARARNFDEVAKLAEPQYFRTQFIDGRDPGDIFDDIRFSYGAAKVLQRTDLLFALTLTSNEIAMRADVIGEACFRVHLEFDELRDAKRMLSAGGVALPVGMGFELVDRLLMNGRFDEARALFMELEPIDELYGSVTVDTFNDTSELHEWAHRALVFRDIAQFNACIDRIQIPEKGALHFVDGAEFKAELRFVAAKSQVDRAPGYDHAILAKSLNLWPPHAAELHIIAAKGHLRNDDKVSSLSDLSCVLPHISEISSDALFSAAAIAIDCEDLSLGDAFFQRMNVPSIADLETFSHSPNYPRTVSDVIEFYRIAARLGYEFQASTDEAQDLGSILQLLLEKIGFLTGEAQAHYDLSWNAIDLSREALRVVAFGFSDHTYDYKRWKLDGAVSSIVTSLMALGRQISESALGQIVDLIDDMTGLDRSRLRRPDVRRTFAVLAYQFDRDANKARRRIDYHPNSESSPEIELSEGAETAISYSKVGLKSEAIEIFRSAFASAVGYSRPARKDPQYLLWKELFERACTYDPDGRKNRVEFMGRFLSGLSETEGSNAGSRIADTFVRQSVFVGDESVDAAFRIIEKTGLLSWHDLIAGLTVGTSSVDSRFAAPSALIYSRLASAVGDEHCSYRYTDILQKIPRDEIPLVADRVIQSIETDCHPAQKILTLESVAGVFRESGYNFGHAEFVRWKAELPLPRSGASPEDPFFHTRTLHDIASCIETEGEGSSSYGAARAFERIAPKSPYFEVKAVFEKYRGLNSDETAIVAFAKCAIANREMLDAERCLDSLKTLAQERGGWGGWGYSSRMRFHEIDVAIHGEEAKKRTFLSIAQDLEHGSEGGRNILPDMVDIFDLISPAPNWALMWEILEAHLKHFREFSMGTEMVIVGKPPDVVATLSGLLLRALSLTTMHLTQMVHIVSVELLDVANGPEIVCDFILRAWEAGFLSDAVQVAWICRHNLVVESAVSGLVPEFFNSDDVACKNTAANLALFWGLDLGTFERDLPAFYDLHLPASPLADIYKAPTGFSATSSGLLSADPYARTWPLKSVIRITAQASGVEPHKLRLRAASFMEKISARIPFDGAAQKAQQSRLRMLDLQIPYYKLDITAAFFAMREVIGELLISGSLDPGALPLLLWLSGGYPSCLAELKPETRPASFQSPKIGDEFSREDPEQWVSDGLADLEKPIFPGYEVVAASAVHKQRRHGEVWRIEQYFGPANPGDKPDLASQLNDLPECFLHERVIPLYKASASRGVAHVDAFASGSIVGGALTICPVVADKLGWTPSEDNALEYLDSGGQIAAKTIFWRDGGMQINSYDRAVFRKGFALLLRNDLFDDVRRNFTSEVTSKSWRTISGEKAKSAIRSRAHHV